MLILILLLNRLPGRRPIVVPRILVILFGPFRMLVRIIVRLVTRYHALLSHLPIDRQRLLAPRKLTRPPFRSRRTLASIPLKLPLLHIVRPQQTVLRRRMRPFVIPIFVLGIVLSPRFIRDLPHDKRRQVRVPLLPRRRQAPLEGVLAALFLFLALEFGRRRCPINHLVPVEDVSHGDAGARAAGAGRETGRE